MDIDIFYPETKLPALKGRAFDLSVELSSLRGSSLAAAEYLNQTMGLESEIDGLIGSVSLEYEVMAVVALMELVMFNIKAGVLDVETTNILLEKIFVRHLQGSINSN